LGEEFLPNGKKEEGQMAKRCLIFGMVFLLVAAFCAAPAWAGMFPDQDAKIAAAKAKSIVAGQRAAAEKAAIAKKYEQQDLERRAAVQTAAVTKPAVSEDRGLPSPVKTLILAPFTTVGTTMMALVEGVKYVTKSPLENPVSRICRGVNTAKSQLLYHPVNVAKEFFTGFTGKTDYYDPAKLNWLGERAQKRGPVAQIAETAGTVIPPVAASTGIVAPFLGLTVPEMAITTGAISAVGSIGVGEAFDAAEKKLVK
jgi:hypothetical protein